MLRKQILSLVSMVTRSNDTSIGREEVIPSVSISLGGGVPSYSPLNREIDLHLLFLSAVFEFTLVKMDSTRTISKTHCARQ